MNFATTIQSVYVIFSTSIMIWIQPCPSTYVLKFMKIKKEPSIFPIKVYMVGFPTIQLLKYVGLKQIYIVDKKSIVETCLP